MNAPTERGVLAAQRYCVIRDTSFDGLKVIYHVGVLGRCIDKGNEWTWPRHNVRYYDSDGKLDRQAYQRAIKPGDTFESLNAAQSARAALAQGGEA